MIFLPFSAYSRDAVNTLYTQIGDLFNPADVHSIDQFRAARRVAKGRNKRRR